MQRLKLGGSGVLSPSLSPGDLVGALRRLGVYDTLNDAGMNAIYWEIAEINGMWHANEESKEGAATAKELAAIAKSADIVAEALSGHQTGFRTIAQAQATSLIGESLAADARSREPAQEAIRKCRENPQRIAEAALAARDKLLTKSDRNGRDRLMWHDRFTQMLLDIAIKSKVEPTLGNDPVNDVPCGWLFEAATELEAFLYPDMRSHSAAGRGSRLRRSLKRLRP